MKRRLEEGLRVGDLVGLELKNGPSEGVVVHISGVYARLRFKRKDGTTWEKTVHADSLEAEA